MVMERGVKGKNQCARWFLMCALVLVCVCVYVLLLLCDVKKIGGKRKRSLSAAAAARVTIEMVVCRCSFLSGLTFEEPYIYMPGEKQLRMFVVAWRYQFTCAWFWTS